MKPILEIKNISKKFRIHSEKQPYLSIRDSISAIFQKNGNSKEDFYALKDVSFDVNEGDTVGIIGKNGAGKSTLLKILSKITPPTSGKIISRGRIASLLEVGTGFHPELSGRENVFLNGSILGMKRVEIQKNFDAIVDFSGIQKFIDTPLKHYSSGMQLRLAFAVAAFLENEILIIDEVLAVGDLEFQKKCMRKMEDVSKSGRTILFVSHNMGAVRQLCEKSILLEIGELKCYEKTNLTLSRYNELSNMSDAGFNGSLNYSGKYIKRVELFCDGELSNTLYVGCNYTLKVAFDSKDEFDYPILGIIFRDEYGQPLLAVNNKHYVGNIVKENLSKGVFQMNIPFFPLFTGKYNLDIHFGNGFKDLEVLKNIISFSVEKNGINNAVEIPDEKYNRFFIKEINWKIENEIN